MISYDLLPPPYLLHYHSYSLSFLFLCYSTLDFLFFGLSNNFICLLEMNNKSLYATYISLQFQTYVISKFFSTFSPCGYLNLATLKQCLSFFPTKVLPFLLLPFSFITANSSIICSLPIQKPEIYSFNSSFLLSGSMLFK